MKKQFIRVMIDGHLRAIALDRIRTATLTDGRLHITLKAGQQRGVITDQSVIEVIRAFYENQSELINLSQSNEAMEWIVAPGLFDWLTV